MQFFKGEITMEVIEDILGYTLKNEKLKFGIFFFSLFSYFCVFLLLLLTPVPTQLPISKIGMSYLFPVMVESLTSTHVQKSQSKWH